jgi:hypothetical protein
MSRRAKILVSITVLFSVAIAWPVASHFRLKWKLEAYKRHSRDMGEKWSIAEVAPVPPRDDLNGAAALAMALGRINTGLLSSNLPPFMKPIGPGKALVSWKETVLPTQDSTNIWPRAASTVEANEATLEDISAALEQPALCFNLDYSQGFALLLPHLARLKSGAQLLAVAAVMDLHEGRVANAWTNLEVLAALMAKDKDEAVMISTLVRCAVGAIAISATWEGLQSPAIPDAQLKRVQEIYESAELASQAELALEMERVTWTKTFADARESYSVVQSGGFTPSASTSGLSELADLGKKLLEDPGEGIKALAHRYPGYWIWKNWQSYDDELASDKAVQAALDELHAVKTGTAYCPALKALDQSMTQIRAEHPDAGRWLEYSLTGEGLIPRFLQRVSCFEIQRSLLVTAIALKRCQLKYGAYPDQLSKLCPEFLSHPPSDVMDGQPLRYHLGENGSFLLYSAGEDGLDNGGDPTPPQSNEPSPPKQWYRGRDAVWPQPADQEEVKADLDKVRHEFAARSGSRR